MSASKASKAAQRLEAARSDLEDANRKVAGTSGAESAALETQGAYAAWQSAMAAANAEADRLTRLVSKLESEVADEEQRDAARSQARLEADANRAADAAAALIEGTLAEITRLSRGLIEAIAQADQKIAAAQSSRDRDLPALLSTEARVRITDHRDREVISEKNVERWCYAETGERLKKDLVARVHSNDGRAGTLRPDALMFQNIPRVVKRTFRKVIFRPAIRSKAIEPLAYSLVVPPLRGDRLPGWSLGKASSPAAILERIEELSNDTPVPVETFVEFIPVDTDRAADAAA